MAAITMTRSRRSAKAAGTAFETMIARHLATVLDDDRIERRAKTGAKDRGDIGGVRAHGGRVVIECKEVRHEDCAKCGRVYGLQLAGWTAEAQIEAGNDDAICGVVVHKRKGTTNPGEQWVTMTVAELVALITGQRAVAP